MSTPIRRARLIAAVTATSIALTGAVVTGPLVATAADVGFSVDDFAGNQMGTRELIAGNNFCTPSGNSDLTVGGGTMRVDIQVPDAIGCNYGSAQVRWTAGTSVDLEQGGADRVELRYRDVVPNQPSAVTFGLRAVDVNGRVAEVGGLTRNGGPAGDWLTIRYEPAYVGDVAVFDFDSGFDRQHVKSITLFVAATTSNQNVSVTFDGIGTNVGEPSYEAPSFGGADTYAFPPSTATTHSFTVSGNPAPDVALTSAKPAWMTVTTSATSGGTLVTLSGNPGTSYSDSSIRLHADVANSLTADRDLRIVVPSPVAVAYATNTTTLGQAGPLTLGTATSTPSAGIVGPTSGLPAGTGLSISGTSVVLTGAPTVAGDYTISTVVGNAWSTSPFTRSLTVGQAPDIATPAELVLVRGEEMAPVSLSSTGYPAPTFSATGLPSGVSISPSGVVSGTPAANVSAAATVTVVNSFGTDSTQLLLQVGDRPTVSAPTVARVIAGASTTIVVDTSGEPTSVTATGLPPGLTLTEVSGSWVVAGIPTRPAAAGEAGGVATFTATSIFGTDLATWSWNVGAAPILAGPTDVSTASGSALAGAVVTADGFPTPTFTVTDADGAALVLPDGLSVDTSTPGAFRIVGTPTVSGTVVARITASNGVGADAVHSLTIRSLKGPSFADAAPELIVEAGHPGSLSLSWSGHETPVLSTTATLPPWLDVELTTGAVVAEPPVGVSGSFGPYAIVATNSSGTATASLTVVVNAPAALTSPAPVTAQQGVALASTAIGTYVGYPSPTITATGLPDGLAIVGTGGQLLISGTPTAAPGEYRVTIGADNGIDSPASSVLTVTVTTPATLSAAGSVSLPLGIVADLPLLVGGYPAPALAATGLPAGLTLDAVNGRLTGTPTVAGDSTVTVTATNGVGDAPAPVAIAITVRAAPLVTLDVSEVHPGDPIRVTASGFVPGESVDVELHSTPRLLATLAAGPTGAIDASVTIPTDVEPGAHTLVVRAASGAEGSSALTVSAVPVAESAGDADPAALSSTGAGLDGSAILALALLALGLALAFAARRRRDTLAR